MIDAFWVSFEICVSLFQCTVLVHFIFALFKPRYSLKTVRIAGACAIFAMFVQLSVLNSLMPFEMASGLIATGIQLVFALVFFKGTVLNKLFFSVFSQAALVVSVVSVNFIVGNIFRISLRNLIVDSTIYRLVFLFGSNMIFFFILRLVIKIRKDGSVSRRDGWILIVNPILSVVALCCVMEMSMYTSVNDIFSVIVVFVILGMMIFSYLMFLEAQKHSESVLKFELMKLQYTNQERSIDQTLKAIKDISTVKHDIRNTNLLLLSYLEAGVPEKAVAELKRQNSLIEEYNRDLFTTNLAINGILSFKIHEAEKLGIKVKSDVLINDLGGIPEADICMILANLLDNATEYCRESHEKERCIWVKLVNYGGYFHISVKNLIYESILKDNEKLSTTKKGGGAHGLGLYSVKRLAENYGGIVDVYEEENKFCVNVALDISK